MHDGNNKTNHHDRDGNKVPHRVVLRVIGVGLGLFGWHGILSGIGSRRRCRGAHSRKDGRVGSIVHPRALRFSPPPLGDLCPHLHLYRISPPDRMRHTAQPFILLLALSACALRDSERIEGTGTLEVVEIDIAPSTAARVERVVVQEGVTVRAGDTLVVLSTPSLRPEIQQREARASAAGAALDELERGARPAELQRAEADLAAATADAARATRDAERLRGLADKQTVSAQQYDNARTLAATATSRRNAAQATLDLLRQGARAERVAAARSDVAGAQAAAEGARAVARDLVLFAPVAGTITNRAAEPGEVLTPGQTALTLAQTNRQTVRVFIGQTALSRVALGQVVHGRLDGWPDREFTGRVVALSSKAEFTPRVALTENERADLMFGVKVEFADTTGMLKAGLPLTVRIDAPMPPPASAPKP